MIEIPSADEIRKLVAPPESVENAKFMAFTTDCIGGFITDNAARLNAGGTITFEFPVVRDMGEYARLWEKHYLKFLGLLRSKGYWCIAPAGTRIRLSIALHKDTSQIGRNRDR